MKTVDSCALFEGIGYIDPEFIQEAYEPLGAKPAPAVRINKLGALAASLVVATALLFGANALFPAFAESLPIVGEAFRQLNSLGTNAPGYDGVVQALGKSAKNRQYQVTATEAYCDGEYIFLALRLDPLDSKLLQMQSLETVELEDAPGWSIEVDGNAGGLVYETPVFTRRGYYFECPPMMIRLPEPAASGTVRVSASITSLSGRTQESIDHGGDGQIVSLEPLALSFDLPVRSQHNIRREQDGVSVDGISLTAWTSSPSKFTVTLSYPYSTPEGLDAAAVTDSGIDLGSDLRENGDFGDGRYQHGGTAVQTCSFTGAPDDTGSVTVTVFSNPSGEERRELARFSIDLKSGKATVAE